MLKWLSSNVYLASWLAVVLAVPAMLFQARRVDSPINWNLTMLRLVYLTFIAAALTPSVDKDTRMVMLGLVAGGTGYFMVKANL